VQRGVLQRGVVCARNAREENARHDRRKFTEARQTSNLYQEPRHEQHAQAASVRHEEFDMAWRHENERKVTETSAFRYANENADARRGVCRRPNSEM